MPVDAILRRPQRGIATHARAPFAHSAAERYAVAGPPQFEGIEFGDNAALDALLSQVRAATPSTHAASVVDGAQQAGARRDAVSPINGESFGTVVEARSGRRSEMAMTAAQAGFPVWNEVPVETRAQILERAANLIEENRATLITLLQQEGGKRSTMHFRKCAKPPITAATTRGRHGARWHRSHCPARPGR